MDEIKLEKIINKKSKKTSRNVLFILLIIILLAITAFFLVNKFFVVNFVEFSSSEIYTFEQLNAAVDIEYGKSIFTFDTEEIKRTLAEKFEYLKNINVKRKYPDTLLISFEEDGGAMYVNIGNYKYVVSGELHVMSRKESGEDDGIKRAQLLSGAVESCIVGEELTFSDPTVAKTVKNIYNALETRSVEGKIKVIDVTDKFNIILTYEDRFTILVGNGNDIVSKVRLFKEVIAELYDDDKGQIDVSDGKFAYVSLK